MSRLPTISALALTLAACDSPHPDWDRMIHQDHFQPLQPCKYFPDGRAMRTPPEGAVARSAIVDDPALSTGLTDGQPIERSPIPLTRPILERGHDRFNIYCAGCHGLRGDGASSVAPNMELRRPPSLLSAELRALAPGRVYQVISEGYGLMPAYAAHLSVEDRWAIVGYVQALKLSQSVALDRLPPTLRAEVEKALP